MKIQQLLATILFVPALLASGSALAAEPVGETVTIRNDGDNTYYEFRINGEISEIKVVPKVGPAYYLIPSEQETNEFVRKDNPQMRVPKWVIFRW
ncbi:MULTISPECIES: DUF2782 domain-containing protein [Oceanospirillaceae]|jgi:hypothetical protein|uniref:DUF2782 domain-containing protein n=1 Tax=Thalassolituus hydrocarboniclasticus TaxID=2742796 RepID=A0ABY6A4Q2_9GAMM|nr:MULTISPECIES: DUF2782 domain-containing protein [Thalassolituus]MAY13940.1 hypothetical protein [Oceanospirillaceae bacterium]PIQ40776.1 MAG: hypothetical protein COW58_03895 [Thalassolituus sp. CG17_big_fil_post_rev_8_21_14_2_50_53_8]MCA6059151.1 DUF2782 domain-containing protein [Thalassolituus sp. ST750PaO-4]MCB2386475.1 DUF2782 domain-containing protein [Thalassolituus alkanivorans]MCB2422958.1 DUF2782 domain-containing protein [Thalassolituus alkanivorans]